MRKWQTVSHKWTLEGSLVSFALVSSDPTGLFSRLVFIRLCCVIASVSEHPLQGRPSQGPRCAQHRPGGARSRPPLGDVLCKTAGRSNKCLRAEVVVRSWRCKCLLQPTRAHYSFSVPMGLPCRKPHRGLRIGAAAIFQKLLITIFTCQDLSHILMVLVCPQHLSTQGHAAHLTQKLIFEDT